MYTSVMQVALIGPQDFVYGAEEASHSHMMEFLVSFLNTTKRKNCQWRLRSFTARLPSSSSTLKHFYLSPPLAFLSHFQAFRVPFVN